ncbi:MAG: hypothetical protein HGA23_03920 [Bacteroidales bacterium]|nr:hypothetical protein [Bacteroidales bacterium]
MALAFQGISLIVWLLYEKSFKKLFTWQHLAGIATFVLITGSYYFAYLQTNSLQDVFSTLFDQSNRFNDKEGTIVSWARHLVVFPFAMSYEFAPWTLLLLLLFGNGIRQATFRDKFSVFCLIIFASNIAIYWVSADMRPRYLFMLFPLLFLIGIKAYSVAEEVSPKIFRLVNLVIRAMAFAGAFSLVIYLFWNETNHLAGLWLIIPILFLVALSAALLKIKIPRQSLVLLIIVLLSVRIGFNALNLPARYNSYPDKDYREGEIIAGQLSKGQEIFILGDTPFNHDASFYISRESGIIIMRTWGISNNQACYITDEINLAKFACKAAGFEVIHEFTIKLKETRLFLIKKPS